MKKSYKSPATEIVEFGVSDIITTSVATDWNYDSDGNKTTRIN